MKTNNVTLVLTPETEEEGLELVETAEVLGSKGIRDLRIMPPWAKEWATVVAPHRNPFDTLASELFPLKVIYSAWLWERNQKNR